VVRGRRARDVRSAGSDTEAVQPRESMSRHDGLRTTEEVDDQND
jgi:hypothetical protein